MENTWVEGIGTLFPTFLSLFGELLLFFVGISSFVAFLQLWLSRERLETLLSSRHRLASAVTGAFFGALTPFCSCSTIPVLAGLTKSRAPFSGTVAFLLTSPVLNPAILALMTTFFGIRVALLYAATTFVAAVAIGLWLDHLGYEREIRRVKTVNGPMEEMTWAKLSGTFPQKMGQAVRHVASEGWVLLRRVLPYLALGSLIGALIHGFLPAQWAQHLGEASTWWAIPTAAVVGMPLYIRAETMIPIAGMLLAKGVAPGVMVSLIIGGAGASIPEVLLLSSLLRKKMLVAFLLSVFFIATSAGTAVTVFLS